MSKVEVAEAPIEYAGQWIAWNQDHTEVISNGDTMMEARENARDKGAEHFWLYKVPDKDTFFGGAALYQ